MWSHDLTAATWALHVVSSVWWESKGLWCHVWDKFIFKQITVICITQTFAQGCKGASEVDMLTDCITRHRGKLMHEVFMKHNVALVANLQLPGARPKGVARLRVGSPPHTHTLYKWGLPNGALRGPPFLEDQEASSNMALVLTWLCHWWDYVIYKRKILTVWGSNRLHTM